MQNDFKEMWSLVNWAVPGGVGERKAYMKYYAKPIQQGQRINADLRTIGIAAHRQKRLQVILRMLSAVSRLRYATLIGMYIQRASSRLRMSVSLLQVP